MKISLEKAGAELARFKPAKPCLKQSVKALIVARNGDKALGSNSVKEEISECPRADMPSGQGYHLCRQVCRQGAHAEVSAIKNALKRGMDIKGAALYLSGHTYCCQPCLDAMREAGIKKVFVLDSGESYEL